MMEESSASKTEDADSDGSTKLECAVCLQNCVQPVQLPCRHIFCYLCVKGVTQQSKRCAMCRQEIPADYLDNPLLMSAPQPSVAFEGSYQWFYEGRNGWWQYDDRTSSEIETAYKKGETQCEVLIAGFLYVIDFQRYVQVRRCDPHRKRQIKRDLVTIAKKGVAGIRSSEEVALRTDVASRRLNPTSQVSPSRETDTDDDEESETEDDLYNSQSSVVSDHFTDGDDLGSVTEEEDSDSLL